MKSEPSLTTRPTSSTALKKVSHDLAYLIAVQKTSLELLSKGESKSKLVAKLSSELLAKLAELKRFIDEESKGG